MERRGAARRGVDGTRGLMRFVGRDWRSLVGDGQAVTFLGITLDLSASPDAAVQMVADDLDALVSRVLSANLRSGDLLFRSAPHEFLVIARGEAGEVAVAADRLSQRLRAALRSPGGRGVAVEVAIRGVIGQSGQSPLPGLPTGLWDLLDQVACRPAAGTEQQLRH